MKGYKMCRPVQRSDGKWYTRFYGPKVSKYVWYQAGVVTAKAEEAKDYFQKWMERTEEYRNAHHPTTK